MPEFLWKIGMGHEIEQAGADAFFVGIEIKPPDFRYRTFFKPAEMRGIVHIPTGGDVMHAADQVIPGRHGRELFDPRFMAGDEIDLQPNPNGQLGKCRARCLNRCQITGKLLDRHPPVIKVFRHRAVIGKPDLRQSHFCCPARIIDRPPLGMAAKAR